MNEKNLNKKDDIQFHQKVHSININNSTGIPKHLIEKNSKYINKVSLPTYKNQNISSEGIIVPKKNKFIHISPSQKSTLINLKMCKTFNKNCSNNSTKAMLSNKNKLKISLTFSGVSSNQNMISTKKRKSLNLNFNNNIIKNSYLSDIKIINSSKNTTKIKINPIFKPKTIRNKGFKKNNKLKKIIKDDDNDIYNFTTDEYDENINENINNSNLRKNYSLTNPSILPCIPFANPFSCNSNNNNITDNNEQKLNHVNSLNIYNKRTEMRKKFILMEKNYRDNLDIINVFQDNDNNEETEKEDDDKVKLNISDLDIDLNKINQDLDEKNIEQSYKKSSFIQFNNNLSLKLASEKSNNTPSYMLALCPKLFLTKNKKDLIKENYAVNEPITEEVDSDSKTPRTSKYKISLEENNTKYSTKDKNSDRNKKFQEIDSEDISFDDEYKKNVTTIENNEEINYGGNKYRKKNRKIIKDSNLNENLDENKNNASSKGGEKIIKKIKHNEIHIETENINNSTIHKESNNINKRGIKFFISKKNTSSHYSNKTINNISYNETENNIVKNKSNKIKNLKYSEINKKHQKAKSLLPDINLSTLYLYETIQNNSPVNNNSFNNKKKIKKINYKPNDNRNKILSREKIDVDKINNQTMIETQKSKKLKNKNKYNTNRNSHYKSNEDKNIYHTSNSNTNINSNKIQLKKRTLGKILKSPKFNINPFILNFSETKDKSIYNNELLNYTLANLEFKYKDYSDLEKKKNSLEKNLKKVKNTMNALETNKENTKNKTESSKIIAHQKKISQQFIDEFNYLLDWKKENNMTINNNKLKISSKDSKIHRYNQNLFKINKENSLISNKSLKLTNKLKNERSESKDKKSAFIVPCHKKSKTFFILPSYAFKKNNNLNNVKKNQNFNKRINNYTKENINEINNYNFNTTLRISHNNDKSKKAKKSKNNTSKKKSKKKLFMNKTKGKNKFKEIKNNIGENTISKIIHKKTNTIGDTKALSFICQNLFNYNNLIQNNNQNNNLCRSNKCSNKNNQHKKSASINNLINNLDNKKKIICAIQRIKFIPVSNYSKVIKEMTQINGNLLVILVYKDENQRFVFRGLYQVNENDPQNAKKIFAPNCDKSILNVNNIYNFYNYSLCKGDFIKYKFLNEKLKKFNEDIVIVF